MGPIGKVLPLAQSIQGLVGGVVYIARQPGTTPRNPSEASEPEPEATGHGGTEALAPNIPEDDISEATDHGATEAATMEKASQISAGAGASTISSATTASPITGNDNIQVGTWVINAQTQDGEEQAANQHAMRTLISGMMNLLRGARAP